MSSSTTVSPRIQISLKDHAKKRSWGAASAAAPSSSCTANECAGRKSEDGAAAAVATPAMTLKRQTTTTSSAAAAAAGAAATTKPDVPAAPEEPIPRVLLAKRVRKALSKQTLNFKINVECTSLRLSPSGNFLWGGFSDGTLRVFDLTGTFGLQEEDPLTSGRNGVGGNGRPTTGGASSIAVNSKLSQAYGAVACQIHARGVHTDLLTTVDISPDGKYVFCGVQRGAMELYAVHVEGLDAQVAAAAAATKKRQLQQKLQGDGQHQAATSSSPARLDRRRGNILDYIHVYCHSDAKLKGFGACTAMRMANSSRKEDAGGADDDEPPQPQSYLLLTGKGIKNIHIWKFTPPPPQQHQEHYYHVLHDVQSNDVGSGQLHAHHQQHHNDTSPIKASSADVTHNSSTSGSTDDDGTWDQLYDTQTNGITIHLLDFYRTPQGKLMAVSKSDVQKLRLWDLSFEEEEQQPHHGPNNPGSARPKRPPYQDVANSHAALGIAGGFCVCGGESMYNQLSIVSLDQPKNAYNHTELALPSGTTPVGEAGSSGGGSSGEIMASFSSSRRQRRGEMRAVVSVAASPQDSSHALLELDDGSLVQYSAGLKGSHNLPSLSLATPESTGLPSLPAEFWNRSLCLANIAGVVMAASCLYNPNVNKGQIVIRALQGLNKPKVIQQPASRSNSNVPGSIGNTPRQIPRSKHLLTSPIADALALRVAVMAPPPSEPRGNNKSEEVNGRSTSPRDLDKTPNLPASCNTTANNTTPAVKAKVRTNTASTARPKAKHAESTTPARPTPDTSPENSRKEGLPLISKYIEPKRIEQSQTKQREMPTQAKVDTPMTNQQTQKKRKVASTSSLPLLESFSKKPRSDKNSHAPAEILKPARQFDIQGSSKKEKKAIKTAKKTETERVLTPHSAPMVPPSVTPNHSSLQRALPTFDTKIAAVTASKSPASRAMTTPSALGAPPSVTPNDRLPQRALPTCEKKNTSVTGSKSPAAPVTTPQSAPIAPAPVPPNVNGASLICLPQRILPTCEKKSTANQSEKGERSTSSVSEIDTARVLASLKSPKPTVGAKRLVIENSDSAGSRNSVGKSAFNSPKPVKSMKVAPCLVSLSPAPASTPRKAATVPTTAKPFGYSSNMQSPIPSKEEVMREKISVQYKQLRTFLRGVVDQSMLSIHRSNLQKLTPIVQQPDEAAPDSNSRHQHLYDNLMAEHRASHNLLQKQLLRSAETSLRLLMESSISLEEARVELKDTIKEYEGVLYDTLQRQEMERLTFVARYSMVDRLNNATDAYPCKAAFEKVEEICTAISRPVGRPKSGQTPSKA